MAGELATMRRKFVDKVTKPVLLQLLDDVLDDGIVNDAEKETVVEEHRSRGEMARCLVDMVKVKGDAACRKMMAHIQTRDPTLFSELGLSCAPAPAPPAEAPRRTDGEGWSTTLIHSTKAFWTQKQNDNDVYPVSIANARNRVALLITNIKFKTVELDRRGAQKDEENMERLLRALGYEVVKYTNLTAKAIDDALIQFSKHPKLSETDSVMVCIMSHGKRGIIDGVETGTRQTPDEFPIDNIYEHLGTAKCPALMNKPKIIIIQACRGVEKGSVFVSDGPKTEGPKSSDFAPDKEMKADTLRIAHKEKDFIALLSSTPDTKSYRSPDTGSFLILFIIDVFNTLACEDDIDELFRKVMKCFEDYSISNYRQMPTKDRCTLTKRFYLFPGLTVI